jgi:hypothetical protein
MNALRIVCGWCARVIAEGTPDGPISHACCPTCLKVLLAEGR